MLLRHISLLPGIEPDPFDHSLFSIEKSSTSNDVNINSTLGCAVSVGSVVDSQVSESPSSLYDSHSVLSTEVPRGGSRGGAGAPPFKIFLYKLFLPYTT